VTEVENLQRVHPDALPGLPQLVPFTAHALVAPKRPSVREHGGEVERSVLGVHVLHEIELAVVPALKAVLEPLFDSR
jgi:hypothetical protein